MHLYSKILLSSIFLNIFKGILELSLYYWLFNSIIANLIENINIDINEIQKSFRCQTLLLKRYGHKRLTISIKPFKELLEGISVSFIYILKISLEK